MGLTKEERNERAKATREITTFDVDGQEEYVFVSYKSDEWEIVLDKIVRYMVDTYGLRVYFDKNFSRDNEIWVKNMSNAIVTDKCKAVLAFVSKKYMVSYACFMELLTARSKTAYTRHDGRKKLPIIPIIVDDSENIRDAMSKSAKEVDVDEWKDYLELLEDTKKSPWIQDDEKLTSWLEQLAEKQELTEEEISFVAEIILKRGYERYFMADRPEPDFYADLKATIEKCSKTVFDPGLIKASSRTSSVKAEPASLPRELYPELKIGELVQQKLKPLLEKKASAAEIRLMQEAEYSKEEFGIQFPLLVESTQPAAEHCYYSKLVNIRGKQYRLCSQWYETAANNDRPFVEKWIKEHQSHQ